MIRQSNLTIFPRTILSICICLLLSGCRNEVDQALGTLEWDRVNGRAPASEVILEVYSREGEYLHPGDPILLLDNRKIVQQLAENKARLEQAQWRLKELENGPRPQAVAEAEARLTAAKAQLSTALSTHRRQQRLYAAKNTSAQQLEESRSSVPGTGYLITAIILEIGILSPELQLDLGIVAKPGPQLPPVARSSRTNKTPQANGNPAIVETPLAAALAARDLLNGVFIILV